MRRSPTAAAFALCLASASAHGADSSSLTSVSLRPTIESMGVDVHFEGDDDGDATMLLETRPAGQAEWSPGHRLLPTAAGRRTSSLLFLQPGTEYEVRVTLDDPDNPGPESVVESARTRPDMPPPGNGSSYYVDADQGDDANDGSQGAPFATVQAAANVAGPGDTVHVAAGIYRETVTLEGSHGGAPDNPLRFVAEPGAVLDGSDPALEDGTAFTLHEGDVYWAPFTGECRYAAVNDERIYDYASLADLQAASAGVQGGFFVDAGQGRIYLRTPDGASPAGQEIHVAHRPVGFLLDTVTDVVIEGFEIRYFGSSQYSGVGVDVRDTSRAWIRDNHIHHMNSGVRVRRPTASDNVIESNRVRDTGVWSWPWASVKAHTAEASAVSVTGGGGNVVRRNVLSGTFNGVYVGAFGDASETIADNTDVHHNELSEHGDDGLEPEGACVNVRFWNNAIRGVHNGVSLAPIEVGPTFVVRTLVQGYKAHALKVNNGPTGWILVYHTTSVPSDEPSAQAIAPSEPFAKFVTRNNIWTGHRYVIESSVTPSGLVDLDYDNLYTDNLDGQARFVKWLDVRYDDLAALKASDTIEQNGFAVVPSYEDEGAGDYTPAEGSGLIDVGQPIAGINDVGVGGAGPDLGAYERGGTGPGLDAGVADGAAGAGGTEAGAAGSGGAAAGAAGTAGVDGGVDAGEDAPLGDYPGDPIDPGCGCRSAGGSSSSTAAALALLVTACAAGRKRRREKKTGG